MNETIMFRKWLCCHIKILLFAISIILIKTNKASAGTIASIKTVNKPNSEILISSTLPLSSSTPSLATAFTPNSGSSSEESTSANIDFFDSEDTNEFFDPLMQQQQQDQQQHREDEYNGDNGYQHYSLQKSPLSHNEGDSHSRSNIFSIEHDLSRIKSTEDQDRDDENEHRNIIYTTMMPSQSDLIQELTHSAGLRPSLSSSSDHATNKEDSFDSKLPVEPDISSRISSPYISVSSPSNHQPSEQMNKTADFNNNAAENENNSSNDSHSNILIIPMGNSVYHGEEHIEPDSIMMRISDNRNDNNYRNHHNDSSSKQQLEEDFDESLHGISDSTNNNMVVMMLIDNPISVNSDSIISTSSSSGNNDSNSNHHHGDDDDDGDTGIHFNSNVSRYHHYNDNNNRNVGNDDNSDHSECIEDDIEDQLFETGTGTGGTTTTQIIPTARTKQGKQIQIVKLLPHEALRNYVEDPYIRAPLAVVVDTASKTLEKTKVLWKEALRINTALDIVLLAFNASGVSVTYHFQNTRTFLAGLESIKEEDSGLSGNILQAITRAVEHIPYDSAIFVNTAGTMVPNEEHLGHYATTAVLKKRIRLYLIWFGDKSLNENETQGFTTGGILGEIATRSGGEILNASSPVQKRLDDTMLILVSDNYRGPQQVEIPVEPTMTNLHINVDSPMRSASLETPNGEIHLKHLQKYSFVNNSNITVAKNGRRNQQNDDSDKLNIFLPLGKFLHSSKFSLKLVPENENRFYHVLIQARVNKLQDQGEEIFNNNLEAMNLVEMFPDGNRKSQMDKLARMRFPTNEENQEKYKDVEILSKETADEMVGNSSSVSRHDFPPSGNRTDGNTPRQAIIAAAGAGNSADGILRGITKINVGLQSQLLVAPGMLAQIHFEVTNLRSEPVFYSIQVVDEQMFLATLIPQRLWLPAGQTANVVLTVTIPAATPQGTRDKITFTCKGAGQASQSLELKVVSLADMQDMTPPSITWTFGSRCDGLYSSGTSCSERYWNLEIAVQDWETGTLRVQSTPEGIIPRKPFTIGSTSEAARFSYSTSCCQPRVTVTAYDVAGNQRTVAVDVRDILLTEAAIAAITLGILLLIVLIILLVICIIWCCKRHRDSRDLPSFRSPSERR